MSAEQLKQKKSVAATEREENQRFVLIIDYFIYFVIHDLIYFYSLSLNSQTALHLQNDRLQPGDEVHP